MIADLSSVHDLREDEEADEACGRDPRPQPSYDAREPGRRPVGRALERGARALDRVGRREPLGDELVEDVGDRQAHR
jgi:hypothetical protein